MRCHHGRITLAVLLALPLLTLVGCDRGEPLAESANTVPSEIVAGATGDIEGTHASYAAAGQSLIAVVWSDLPALRSGSSEFDGDVSFTARHASPEGLEIHWRADVSSSLAGSIRINGHPFDLASGRVLLARMERGRPIVRQLNLGVTSFSDLDLTDCLRGWLESEPEVREFFAAVLDDGDAGGTATVDRADQTNHSPDAINLKEEGNPEEEGDPNEEGPKRPEPSSTGS